MLAFITSSDGPEFLLTLNATNTDDAIRELAEQYRDTLVQCGKTEHWMDQWVEEEKYVTPAWETNVRIICLCHLYLEDPRSAGVLFHSVGGCPRNVNATCFTDHADHEILRMAQ